ncbi:MULTISPECIES: fimbrial protein [Pseudomonas]|uniref:Fimbrial protein n=1 Tax=Pseudomonas chlororaphis subsp. aureofaciens TaxID=587851 RepID=A0AAD0ZBN5_9PSED|nr:MULTISPECIES: fimbrial protein [Pseudomonas]AZD90930.1 putative fimbrial protein [Pseudomonas chlororaphis subsp. aureofaciens]AZD97394.1 putative fimbrial protein [Pseudomonas chlororaphis subsp. aureofaciens]AZE21933.1 putative fimbrial protein [Pseudomonas chlororaphis subsp. aureofaciens]AZE28286.1 putative fimbrial protein [Pseudomonas chlororaphis subsp. aureofaciens]AZE34533.1 putative fimbrial protein [Pseudomonas chlororaphis subsp. aureofaciens]
MIHPLAFRPGCRRRRLYRTVQALACLLPGLIGATAQADMVESQAIDCSFSNNAGLPWVEVTALTSATPVGAVLWQRPVALITNYKYGGGTGNKAHELVSAGHWSAGTPLPDGIAPTNISGIGFKIAVNSSDGVLREISQTNKPVAQEKNQVMFDPGAGQNQRSVMVTNYIQSLILTVPPSQLPSGELIVKQVDGSSRLTLYAVDLLKGVASLGEEVSIPNDNIPIGICRKPYPLMGPAIINMGGGPGPIIPNKCEVESYKTIPVKLGRFSLADFPKVGSTSSPVPFRIELSQCALNAKPQITFTDKVAGHTDPSVLNLTASPNSAKGFGIIMINDLNQQRIKYDGTLYDMQRVGDSAIIPLRAGYIRTGSDAEVKVGDADGAAEFTFTFP